MAKIFRMPEVAANATHAVLQSWTKREGDSVAQGDCIAEIETDKAMVEVNVDIDGILARVLAKDGQEIAVGAPIAVVVAAGESTDIDALLAGSVVHNGAGVEASTLSGSPAGDSPSNVEATPLRLADEGAVAVPDLHPTVRVFASPLAKRIARERGVDLGSVKGSGPNGRIVKRDIGAMVERQQDVSPTPTAPTGRAQSELQKVDFTEIPHTGMRRAIARRLSESKSSVPHFYLSADCRVDKLIGLRSEVNEGATTKVSINDFVVKAVAVALKQIPEMNVTWTDAALRRYSRADISVAVSTDTGLFTPVVRGADSKSLSAISSEIAELATRARAGRLRQEELEGGSFSVSNLGMFGTQEFAAIINPPQSAILAVGAAIARPVIEDGNVAAATVMRCTLSIDHRAIDGALAARWLKLFVQLVENPLSMLI